MVILFLVFLGTSTLLSIVATPTYISTKNVGGFPFLHTFSRSICYLQTFYLFLYFSIILFIYLMAAGSFYYAIYLMACWVFMAPRAFPQLQQAGATLQLWCEGFSLRWLLLWIMGSRAQEAFSSCSSQTLKHRLNGCGAWAQLLCGMWDLPKSGIELLSSALAGEFFTTEPLGKPCRLF